jgi:hypothetical protein
MTRDLEEIKYFNFVSSFYEIPEMNNQFDDFDDVINVEKTWYHSGKVEGEADADRNEFYQDGFHTGYSKGLEYFTEISFYSSILILEEEKMSENQTASLSRRKKLKELQQRISIIPETNQEDFDYEHEIDSIRSLFKALGFGLTFPPLGDKASKMETSEW